MARSTGVLRRELRKALGVKLSGASPEQIAHYRKIGALPYLTGKASTARSQRKAVFQARGEYGGKHGSLGHSGGQLTVGQPVPLKARAEKVARSAHEQGLDLLRPGEAANLSESDLAALIIRRARKLGVR